jgi:hypothetical protein
LFYRIGLIETFVSHDRLEENVSGEGHICNTRFEWLIYKEDDILCENYCSESDTEEGNIYVINPQLVVDLTSNPHIDCPLPKGWGY